MEMRKFTSLVLAAAMGAGLLAGCGSSSSTSSSTASSAAATASVVTDTTSTTTANASSGDTFKIGVIGPLTGGASAYGTAVLYGAQVAANEINAAGGINGYQVEIVSADDENDAQKSVNCYNTLKDKGMQILAGTVTSNPCIAVADYTKQDNMFQITPSGSAEKCIANDNVFRTCFADPEQGTLSADYMSENKLGKKVGIIYDQSDSYSSGIHDAFVKEAKKDGLDVVSDEAFNADNKTDFSVQIQAAQDAGADILFLPFYYTEASLVLQQAKKMQGDGHNDIDVVGPAGHTLLRSRQLQFLGKDAGDLGIHPGPVGELRLANDTAEASLAHVVAERRGMLEGETPQQAVFDLVVGQLGMHSGQDSQTLQTQALLLRHQGAAAIGTSAREKEVEHRISRKYHLKPWR